MQMREGLIVSGTGHVLLLGWALVAGVFNETPSEDTFSVSEVALISTAEFDALVSNAPSPDVSDAPTPIAPQDTVQTATPQAQEAPRVVTPTPQLAPSAPEAPPQVAILTPPPRTEVQPQTPAAPEAPPASDPNAPLQATRPTPRPAPRVAPTPAPPSEAEIAPVVQEAPTPTETAEAPAEETPTAAAPEEATTEIVTEAEQPSRAPEQSNRPRRKPTPPAPIAVAEAANDTPAETSVEVGAEQENPLASVIAGLQSAAEQETQATAPSGPPLSGGEVEGFRVAVQSCWNVDVGAEWARTAVTIAFDMNRDGTPVSTSLRMVGFRGGTDATARQAYEAGRRAILRCGARGFDLPDEKYDHWKEIEITFDPESMRIR